MKLKKINKHGEYVVTMSQMEVNIINDLLCYVNPWHTEHEVIKNNCSNLMNFFNEHSTFELEDLFGAVVVDNCECCGEPMIELVPVKEQTVV